MTTVAIHRKKCCDVIQDFASCQGEKCENVPPAFSARQKFVSLKAQKYCGVAGGSIVVSRRRDGCRCSCVSSTLKGGRMRFRCLGNDAEMMRWCC